MEQMVIVSELEIYIITISTALLATRSLVLSLLLFGETKQVVFNPAPPSRNFYISYLVN